MSSEKPKENIKIEPSFGDQDDPGFPGEIRKSRDGRKFQWQDSGYSLREYYSHEGPGWDWRWDILEKYGVQEVEQLPDNIRIYCWEEIFDNE